MVLTPVNPVVLRARLQEGITQFAFKKLDGDLRTAVGTTNLGSIPMTHHPKGTGKSPSNVVAFFDVEKQAWRSVSTSMEIFVTDLH